MDHPVSASLIEFLHTMVKMFKSKNLGKSALTLSVMCNHIKCCREMDEKEVPLLCPFYFGIFSNVFWFWTIFDMIMIFIFESSIIFGGNDVKEELFNAVVIFGILGFILALLGVLCPSCSSQDVKYCSCHARSGKIWPAAGLILNGLTVIIVTIYIGDEIGGFFQNWSF